MAVEPLGPSEVVFCTLISGTALGVVRDDCAAVFLAGDLDVTTWEGLATKSLLDGKSSGLCACSLSDALCSGSSNAELSSAGSLAMRCGSETVAFESSPMPLGSTRLGSSKYTWTN